MSGVNIGTRATKTNIRDACVYGGFQTTDRLYFRDTGIYIRSSADGTLELVSDGTLTLTATTEIRLNAPSVNVYHGAITVGAFGATEADTMNIAIQLNQGDEATACTEAIAFKLYLSTDAAGQTVDAAPSAGFAVGTDGLILVEHTANVLASCVTEADGDFDINMKDTASASTYVNVILPSGQIITSSLCKFT